MSAKSSFCFPNQQAKVPRAIAALQASVLIAYIGEASICVCRHGGGAVRETSYEVAQPDYCEMPPRAEPNSGELFFLKYLIRVLMAACYLNS